MKKKVIYGILIGLLVGCLIGIFALRFISEDDQLKVNATAQDSSYDAGYQDGLQAYLKFLQYGIFADATISGMADYSDNSMITIDEQPAPLQFLGGINLDSVLSKYKTNGTSTLRFVMIEIKLSQSIPYSMMPLLLLGEPIDSHKITLTDTDGYIYGGKFDYSIYEDYGGLFVPYTDMEPSAGTTIKQIRLNFEIPNSEFSLGTLVWWCGIYQAGYYQGWDTGYYWGSEISFNDGYKRGLQDGFNQGMLMGHYQGYEDGYTEGYEEGERSGFDKGIGTGYDTGYDDGYWYGYDIGREAGYSWGYNLGEAAGYERGLASSIGDATGITGIAAMLSNVMSVFEVKIFGWFSLGDIVGIVLIFGIVFFALKFIRG